MEIKFQGDLDFQIDAIRSVTELFKSQKPKNEDFVMIPENGVISNILDLSEHEILENMREIQNLNGIKLSDKLEGLNFSVEMETGTGKTYVYLRTIFELNKKYGFKKFIIIVPTIAIREGTIKNLKITEKHFKELYENIPYKYYDYNSKKINQIRQFTRGNKIEIMIMTIDSFNKDTNIMNQERDILYGEKPIDLVKKTKPILILDEPQNMESDNAKQAIESLNPLFTLRYSATHRNYYNLVYRLTPYDAYKRNLVKKIDVLSVVKQDDFNTAFIRCMEITTNKRIKARVQVNKKVKNGFKVTEIVVSHGDDLFEKTGSNEYDGFVINEINARYKFIKFSNGITINEREEQEGDRREIMRVQIEQTIEEHFKKYENLKKYGIKVISLFFIDAVDNYYTENGILKKFFEDSFNKIKRSYNDFKNTDVNLVHKGYFSKMRTASAMERDNDAFDLIMKDKERLLSLDNPVQFIFSHSALREGWDNPNVFNICTLNETVSNIKKRQEIGRGMRLPVNQNGERILNEHCILTVIANESYVYYVSKLQQEYIDDYGVDIPPKPANAKKRTTLRLKKGYQLNPEFIQLWERIAKRTEYAIDIETKTLIKQCIDEINNIDVNSIEIKIERFELRQEENKGIQEYFIGFGTTELNKKYDIPDIIGFLSNETKLTRVTIVKILTNIANLHLIFRNPQAFVSSVMLIIKEKLADLLVKGISYLQVNEWYKMELFRDIQTYSDMVVPVEKTLFDNGVIADSIIEKSFAEDLERMNNVKFFIKLPDWFIIDTPIGGHNPDWAIVMDDVDQFGNLHEKLFFVTETKGTTNIKELRQVEQIKIKCAEKHFQTIDVDYKVVKEANQILYK